MFRACPFNYVLLAVWLSLANSGASNAQENVLTDRPAPAVRAPAEEFVFESNGFKLNGCIMRPLGRGPFPAVIFNHGSEKVPVRCGPPALARMYLSQGFLFFAFQRHGHTPSPGDYIVDVQKQIFSSAPQAEIQQRIVELHESYNHDVTGAVQWLMTRGDVDPQRIIMTGISFGGIQTLLTAEKGLGIRAFIAFAPAAMSWRNVSLRQRLLKAVTKADAPVFLAQAANDFSTGPTELLGPVINAKKSPNVSRLYPAFGATPREGHGLFATGPSGIAIWRKDLLSFLEQAIEKN